MRRIYGLSRLMAVLSVLILCLLVCPVNAESVTEIDQMDAVALMALRERIDLRLRALGEYPFVKLSEGSKGDEVTALQKRLRELGYFNQEPDGRYRQTTINAVKAFEKAMGLKRDGVATADVQKLIFAPDAPALPTPTPSPTPKPTNTPRPSPVPQKDKDYAVYDYRLTGLMPDKYYGSRYRFRGTVLAMLDDGTRWLVQAERDSGLIAVQAFPAQRSVGDSVQVWGEYIGLTEYQSESGSVTLPLFKCEYLE